jgi:hypothetical protein
MPSTRCRGIAALLLAVVACGEASAPAPPGPPAHLAIVGDTSWLLTGQPRPLSASVRDSLGTVLSGATVTWSSSDPLIASVSSSGTVTPIKNGNVRIRAQSGAAGDSLDYLVDGVIGPQDSMELDCFGTSQPSVHGLRIMVDVRREYSPALPDSALVAELTRRGARLIHGYRVPAARVLIDRDSIFSLHPVHPHWSYLGVLPRDSLRQPWPLVTTFNHNVSTSDIVAIGNANGHHPVYPVGAQAYFDANDSLAAALWSWNGVVGVDLGSQVCLAE